MRESRNLYRCRLVGLDLLSLHCKISWLGKQNTDLWMMSDGNAQKLICACHWFWFCNASILRFKRKFSHKTVKESLKLSINIYNAKNCHSYFLREIIFLKRFKYQGKTTHALISQSNMRPHEDKILDNESNLLPFNTLITALLPPNWLHCCVITI